MGMKVLKCYNDGKQCAAWPRAKAAKSTKKMMVYSSLILSSSSLTSAAVGW
jgi:hypothetical protein